METNTWVLTLPAKDENDDDVDNDAVLDAISDFFGFNYDEIKLERVP